MSSCFVVEPAVLNKTNAIAKIGSANHSSRRQSDLAPARQNPLAAFCKEVRIDRFAHDTQRLDGLRRVHSHSAGAPALGTQHHQASYRVRNSIKDEKNI
jgi:hypothetical protein